MFSESEKTKRKEELRRIAKDFAKLLKKKYKVKEVYLIGSLRTTDNVRFIREDSDIDLVVKGMENELYLPALAELYEILPFNVMLDLIPFEDTNERFKKRTIEQGEIL
jgi:predicted nucleotidyltransferase